MFELNMDKTSWLNFVKEITKPNNYEETCAWLYIDTPFESNYKIYVYPVKNIGLPGESTRDTFSPDKKDFRRVKKEITKLGLTKIGNLHTHVLSPKDWWLKQNSPVQTDIDAFSLPSGRDLKFARKFNDVLRGILTIVFYEHDEKGYLVRIVFHNKYGIVLSKIALPNGYNPDIFNLRPVNVRLIE